MKKAFMMLVLTALSVVVLVACNKATATLSKITWTGVTDVEDITFDSEFNILTGVVAMGDDNVDYSDQITWVTVNPSTVDSEGYLDTQTSGTVAVKYVVTVGDFVQEKWRYLTVLP